MHAGGEKNAGQLGPGLGCIALAGVLVLVLVLHNCAVTVSSTGAEDQFQADDNCHVGRPCEVSLAPPYPELFARYGASAVTRTSGRGHVAEAKTNVIEVSGLSIRVSPSHP